MEFKLDENLKKDSFFIKDMHLSQLRLIDNANFPWVILVPRLNDIVEIIDLSAKDFFDLNQEVLIVSKVIKSLFKPDKLNIATIGNKVKQLHYHVVARYNDDCCFPDAVWGNPFIKYSKDALKKQIMAIEQQMFHVEH